MPRKGAKLSPEAMKRQTDAQRQWHEANYARISLAVRKDKKARYQKLADTSGKSLNGLVAELLDNECEKAGIE